MERPALEIAVNSAIFHFNEGQFGLTKVFQHLNIQSGVCFANLSITGNQASVRYAGCPLRYTAKMWEIWEFILKKYGSYMGFFF